MTFNRNGKVSSLNVSHASAMMTDRIVNAPRIDLFDIAYLPHASIMPEAAVAIRGHLGALARWSSRQARDRRPGLDLC